MTERKKGQETATRERQETPPTFDEVKEGDIVSADEVVEGQATEQIAIKAVEFGKLPTTKHIEKGKQIADLVNEGFLSPNQEFYVNGALVDQNYLLCENDAVVGAPRVAGG